jgi:hypothetical protein
MGLLATSLVVQLEDLQIRLMKISCETEVEHLNKQCRTKQNHGPESCTTPHHVNIPHSSSGGIAASCRVSRLSSPALSLKKWFLYHGEEKEFMARIKSET